MPRTYAVCAWPVYRYRRRRSRGRQKRKTNSSTVSSVDGCVRTRKAINVVRARHTYARAFSCRLK